MLKTSVLFCHVTSVLLLLNIFGLLSALFSYVTSFLLSNVFSAADRACSRTPPRSKTIAVCYILKTRGSSAAAGLEPALCWLSWQMGAGPAPTGTNLASRSQAGVLRWLRVGWGESWEQLAACSDCANLSATARGMVLQPACRHI